MRILVAGGAGFIGSHLCRALLARGHDVLCVDNLVTGLHSNIAALLDQPGFTFRQQDITLPFEAEVDGILHLASPASPEAYRALPLETIRANSLGTMLLLELARRTGARFLFASTSEVYGDPQVYPQPESYWGHVNPVGERACYDEGKRFGEALTMEYHRVYGLDVRIVRIFNTYGPHHRPDDGRMIPAFITAALHQEPLVIHGTGQQTRTLCYVDDLVDGLMRALFTPEIAGMVFNLGSTEARTVVDWAYLILELTKSPSPLVFIPKRADDPERRCPAIERAQQLLGWQPTTTARAGLAQTIAWFRHAEESYT